MTVSELINKFQRLKPNQMDTADILSWLTNVDQTVTIEILQPRTQESKELPVYTAVDDTPLLIPTPYAEAYVFYLAAMVDFWTQDMNGYNNSMYAYSTMFSNYRDYYNRTFKMISAQSIRV